MNDFASAPCPRASFPPDPVSPDRGDGGLTTGRDEAGTAARQARHLAILAELAEIGMDLAREVRRQALGETASGATAGAAECGLAFSRISRAVRQTVALEARLAAGEIGGPRSATPARPGAGMAGDGQKIRVRRFIEAAIAADGGPDERESLRQELNERLEDADFEADFARLPIGMVVAAICDDLGIEADLRDFTDAELGFDVAPTAGDADPAPSPAAPVPRWPPRHRRDFRLPRGASRPASSRA